MKNIKYILVSLIVFVFVTISQCGNSKPIAANKAFENSTSIKDKQFGRKTKDGRYKRKKGFMWGLFKKKSDCDCPKH